MQGSEAKNLMQAVRDKKKKKKKKKCLMQGSEAKNLCRQ